MTYSINKNGTVLEVTVSGRLDTVSAPDLEKALIPVPEDIDTLSYDFSSLDYISSAGLRTLLRAHRNMKAGGKTKITGCNSVVKEVFVVTGMTDLMEIN
ncbi:MAG: STAS domain-containing protein [Clostridia bacterium]|nr:STAS domain-containing protein [Clostridia bacterium]